MTMMSRTSISTNQTRKFINQVGDDIVYNISESELRLGFSVQCGSWLSDIPLEEYFTIRVLQELDTTTTHTAEYYSLETWGDDFYDGLFNMDNINALTSAYGDILWVPKNKDLSVSILDGGKWSQDLYVIIEHWRPDLSNGVNWQDTQEIIYALYDTKVTFFMKGKYFDFTDLDNPIKFFIREEEIRLTSNHTKYSYMTLK